MVRAIHWADDGPVRSRHRYRFIYLASSMPRPCTRNHTTTVTRNVTVDVHLGPCTRNHCRAMAWWTYTWVHAHATTRSTAKPLQRPVVTVQPLPRPVVHHISTRQRANCKGHLPVPRVVRLVDGEQGPPSSRCGLVTHHTARCTFPWLVADAHTRRADAIQRAAEVR